MTSLASDICISVIVPLFNKQQYIVECLNSVVSQRFKKFEVIIVDDGSTDASVELINKHFLSKVRLIQQNNQGLGAARNAGIKVAQGEFLLFVDSDDEILPDCLEKIYAVAMRENADITEFNYAVINNEKQLLWQTNRRDPSDFISALTCKSDSSACNRLFRRSLFLENKITFLTDVYYEDVASTYKLYFYSKKNASLDHVLYYYYVREDSITSTISARHIHDMYRVLQSTQNFLNDNNVADNENLFRLRLLRCFVMMAKKLIESSQFDENLFTEFIEKFKTYRYVDSHEHFLVNRNESVLVTDFRRYLAYSDMCYGKSRHEILQQMSGMSVIERKSSRRLIANNDAEVSIDFSRKFNRLVEQVSLLTLQYCKIVVYGYGVVGKLATDVLGNHVALVVDKNPDATNGTVSPDMIKKCDFDYILVCVLGREETIERFLIEELKISADKIGSIVF